jgi:hypothetical protein
MTKISTSPSFSIAARCARLEEEAERDLILSGSWN